MKKEVTDLTKTERILMYRKRHGLSQRELANKFEVPKFAAMSWEKYPIPPELRQFYPRRLNVAEYVTLLRHRLGISRVNAANGAGINHLTAIRIEHGESSKKTEEYTTWLETALNEKCSS